MDYRNVYNRIIEHGKQRQLTGYKETHHIIPRCLGGSDNADNLVDLTAREHFVAHQLLTKIYPNHRGLALAAVMMTVSSDVQQSYNRSKNRCYGWLREKANSMPVSDETKDKIRQAMIGRKHTEETKQKISRNSPKLLLGKVFPESTRKKLSDAKKGEKRPMYGKQGLMHGWLHSDETKRKMSETRKGYRVSDETRKRIAESNIGKHNLKHDNKTKKVISDASIQYWQTIRNLQTKYPELTVKEIRRGYSEKWIR